MCCSSLLFWKNCKSLTYNLFVYPGVVTFVYSQERSAKKKAPAVSWPMASSRAQEWDSHSVLKIRTGRAFWVFSAGSALLYELSWRLRGSSGRPAGSSPGSSRKFVRKGEHTLPMMAPTVRARSTVSFVDP